MAGAARRGRFIVPIAALSALRACRINLSILIIGTRSRMHLSKPIIQHVGVPSRPA